MLSKKTIKIISIALIAVILLMTFVSPSFAIADQFGGDDGSAIAGTNAGNMAKVVLGSLKWVGVAIAVGMMIFLGIKYVTSSPEGKANLKGQLGVYILGVVFITSATAIVTILENTLKF